MLCCPLWNEAAECCTKEKQQQQQTREALSIIGSIEYDSDNYDKKIINKITRFQRAAVLNKELLLAEKHLFFMDMTSPESLSANSTELKVLAVCNIEQINDWMFVSVLKSQ